MTDTILKGKISYINHANQNATIEYLKKEKKKEVHTNLSVERQQEWINQKIIKKIHQYHVGDEVKFTLDLSPRGDKQMATNVQYIGNNDLANLLYRAQNENRFFGFLKLADDKYFIKETGSYYLFPVKLSPWERAPSAEKLNEPIMFALENFDKPEKVSAVLYKPVFIHEYRTAEQLFNSKAIIDAVVYKTGPHGIYLNVVGEKIQAKIALPASGVPNVGDKVKVKISFLNAYKIVVEMV